MSDVEFDLATGGGGEEIHLSTDTDEVPEDEELVEGLVSDHAALDEPPPPTESATDRVVTDRVDLLVSTLQVYDMKICFIRNILFKELLLIKILGH